MKKIKVNVNRIELSKEVILKNRNFDEIIQKVNFSSVMLRNPWFYGVIGISGFLGFILSLFI
jgi:hypothetical protein